MPLRLGIALAMSLMALALVPAVSQAATVFTRVMDEFEPQRWIVYEAAAGEANRLVVQDLEGDPIETRFVEAGAPLTVLPDCVAHDGAGPVALCPTGPAQIDLGDRDDVALVIALLPFALRLTAGDGDDRVFADSLEPTVFGGAGNDRIRLGDAVILGSASGGPGRDVIHGGEHGQFLSGGPGDDLIVHQAPIAYGIDGNEGNDVLLLRHVEPTGDYWNANGGGGDDVLFVARPDVPVDYPGLGQHSWFLQGADGRDVLIGGASPDGFDGGAGNDVLLARDGNPEFASCGDGIDVAYADPEDTLVSCEITLSLPVAGVARLRGALEHVSHESIAAPGALPKRVKKTLGELVGIER